MNEHERKIGEQADLPDATAEESALGAAGQAAQAGALLRQLREMAGVDPVLLSSALKVTPQKIQALEEGRLEDLPGLAFARGLAAAICRHCAADPHSVLALMPSTVPGLPVETGVPREPFRPSSFHMSDGDSPVSSRRSAGISGWVLAAVAVLLIGALAIWLMPAPRAFFMPGSRPASAAAQDEQPAASAASAASESASAASGLASASSAAPADHAASQPAPAVSTAVLPSASAEVTASPADQASLSEPAVSDAAASAMSDAASTPAAEQHGSGILEQNVVTFNATGPVWVGVRDGSGKSVLVRLLAQGDTVSAGGELPLSVTVGDKTAVTVTVRGQPFGLNRHSTTRKGVVAHFTVGPADAP
ncbi:MAG: helix-turn-helix domain-containing protein [Burkholderiaceae bacterium]|nr:helix-turn-helix domain-containing protein [Burkholderiaceae bacterium]